MRVLAVAAHPDDIEILCAGTMARYARAGHEVFLCHAAKGDRGSYHHTSEARKSASLIGAESLCLGFSDGGFVANDLAARERFINLFREVKPDLVFTHYPDDYMADHVAVSQLVFDASFMATVPLIETGQSPHDKVVPIFYMDTLAGIGFLPQEYVDITEVIDVKREMLSQHHSQVVWLREHDNIDLLMFMETMSRFRGIQCGVPFAEGFIRKQAWLRSSPERLLP
jgi:LmbE family N-acetylglucosaminyl deacetylase